MDKKSDERRKHRRVSVAIPAGIYNGRSSRECIDAEILSLSEGGAFVHCTAPVDLGKPILLEIRFGETKLFEAVIIAKCDDPPAPEGEKDSTVVVWKQNTPLPGFGLSFSELSDERREFIRRIMAYFSNLERAGVSLPEAPEI